MPVDLSLRIPGLCARLNALGVAGLVFWTEAELYQSLSEALKRLARLSNVFCEADDSTAAVLNQALYPLPARHLAVVMVALDGAVLAPANVAELEALDSNWEEAAAVTTNAAVTHWAGDPLGCEYIALYKIPAAGGALLLILSRFPVALTATAPTVRMPEPVADYLTLAALSDARGKESDARMPEVAEHLGQRLKLYEQLVSTYWGGGL